MKTITKFLLTTLCCTLFFTSQARHLLGGTFAYKIVAVTDNIATVEVTLYIYRDANGGGAFFDTNLELAVYKYSNNDYEFVSNTRIPTPSVSTIEIEQINECFTGFINYELGTYVAEIELPVNNIDFYTIAYQRCCRDQTITNIIDPDVVGMAITMNIYPPALVTVGQEVDTQFEFPAAHKIGAPLTFDFSVEDEFDKSYYLTTPKAAGGIAGVNFGDPRGCDGITPNPSDCLPEFDEVEWVSQNHPYGLNSNVELDEETGILSVDIPEVNKTLVGLTIDRFFNGELASKIRQQFLINTLNCSITNTTEAEVDEFSISPNPTNGLLTFSSALTEVSIRDVTGKRQVLTTSYKSYENLDLSHLENGVYYLRGKTLDDIWVFKKVLVVK